MVGMSSNSESHQHLLGFLQRVCSRCESWVHIIRMQALMAAVVAVVRGGSLVFSNMGRALPGRPKAGIKRIDRLMSNAKLHRELPLFYGAIAHKILAGVKRPIVLVD